MKAQEILMDIIGLRTDDKVENNKLFVDYVVDILQRNNVRYKRLPNKDGKNENIIAGINIEGFKNINSGIAFSGHMDTVGANVKDWDTNPFVASKINNAIYGRGTVDMKYFIAVILGAIPELKKIGMPIFFLLTCDEETEVQGIEVISNFLQMRNIHPQYALIGEPTNNNLCVANKGYLGFRTVIKGIAAHSSTPDIGVNAAYIAAKFVSKIEELSQQYISKGTTLNVGVVIGGEGRNSIPSEINVDWEIRYFEQKHQTEILEQVALWEKELSLHYKNSFIRTETKESLPVFERKDNSEIVQTAQKILKSNITTMPHATEAGFLQRIGIDTLICGAGDEKLAHSSCEHIDITDMQRYESFIIRLAQELALLNGFK